MGENNITILCLSQIKTVEEVDEQNPVGEAYLKVAVLHFNPDIFTNVDFIDANTTDQEEDNDSTIP